MSDWYGITRTQVIEAGGGRLFDYYSSLSEALRYLHPDYSWEQDKFFLGKKPPPGYWQGKQNLKDALRTAERQLDIDKVLLLSFFFLLLCLFLLLSCCYVTKR